LDAFAQVRDAGADRVGFEHDFERREKTRMVAKPRLQRMLNITG